MLTPTLEEHLRSLILLTAVAIAAATLVAAPAGAQRTRTNPASFVRQVVSLRQGIRWHRTMTWRYQDEAGVRRTPTAHAERKTTSLPFLRWIDHRWSARRIAARHLAVKARRSLAYTGDWQTAVQIVQRTWPGTATWLLSTSSGEGGWGICVWNGGAPCSSSNHGSGAAGWLQYMSGTFYSQLSSALAEARAEHRPTIPASARTWFSPLGQAFAGGWGCHHNASAWSRPSC